MTVKDLFEQRYGGKDPNAMADDHEDFTAIEMLNFADHCVASLRSELANYKAKSEGLEIQAKALQDSVITNQEIVYGLRVELAEKEKELSEQRKEVIEECIDSLCSVFPDYGNREFSIRCIRNNLDQLKNTKA